MEDGIENYKSTIWNDMKTNNQKIMQKYIYIYNKKYGSGEYTIIPSEEEAIVFSKEKNCRVDIYTQEIKNFYTPTTQYFKNGIKYKDN